MSQATTNPEQTEAQELQDMLQTVTDPATLIVIGRRCQQLAFESTDISAAEACADQATLAFIKAQEGKGSVIDRTVSTLARFALELEPLARPLIVERRMPDLATVAEVNFKIIRSLSKLKYTPETSHTYDVFAVNSLRAYWQVNEYQAEDELALPSFLTRPFAEIEKDHTLYARDGDISVFFWDGKLIKVVRRFQVANGEPKFDTGLSSPDLPTIRISQDLRIHFDELLDQKDAEPDEEDAVLTEEPSIKATDIVAELRMKQASHRDTILRRRAYQMQELLELREEMLQMPASSGESAV